MQQGYSGFALLFLFVVYKQPADFLKHVPFFKITYANDFSLLIPESAFDI